MSRASCGACGGTGGGVVGEAVVVAGDARARRGDRVERGERVHVAVGDGEDVGHVEQLQACCHGVSRRLRRSLPAPVPWGHMAPQFILTMRDLRRVHPPDKEVLRGINISMYPGAKIGVLGANGSGKSTLLRIIAGEDDGYSGECRVTPGFSVGFLPQEPRLDPTKDVLGNVTDGVAHTKGILDRFEEVCNAMGEPDADFDKLLAEQSELQTEIDAVNGWDLDRQLEIAMDALRLPPSDAEVTTLSGGERRRVALCRLLLSKPDLLLLDEPTNHLDAESVAWLERHLQEYHGTVVAVTHDRYFLDNVAGWILELDRGCGHPVGRQLLVVARAEGPTARAGREGRRGAAPHARARARVDPHGAARATGEGQGAHHRVRAARRRSGVGRGAPGEAADHRSRPGRAWATSSSRPSSSRRATANGCSSTTSRSRCRPVASSESSVRTGPARRRCSACSSDRRQPDDGALKIGNTVSFAYVDQSRESLDGSKTVYEEITGGVDHLKVGDREVHGRAYVAGFNFKGSDQQKNVGDMSGGERNRLHLAKALLMGGNVLLLDEPTNDLDVDTLRALEEALLAFPGCAVVISHDRWFIDRIATHVLAFEGESEVVWFEGNFSDYERDRKKRLGADADQPHRIHYKKLTR